MPPALALLLGVAFIGWMLGRDRSWRRLPSTALWIPGLWLAQTSSRPMSFWLAQLGVGGSQSSSLEGSPVNAVFNGSLFLLAILVLHGRRFSWGRFACTNKALCAVYAFFLCSMLWSPFPMPTVRGVVNDFGCVLTGLIILTEKDPAESLRVVFVRVSYILFPLSVVFMKYFPEIGVRVSMASGMHMRSGVADHKNSLGQLAMVFCLVLLWDLMETRKQETASGTKPERWVRLVNLGIGLYLLVVSSSATAGICFLLGVVLLFEGERLARMKNARQVFMVGVLAIACLMTFEAWFGISGRVSEAMGRGAGLHGRTEIWQAVLQHARGSPLVGFGFRAFWETSEGESVWRELQMNRLVQSHNGYLETYLNGGFVGLFLLAVFLLVSGRNATDKLVGGEPIGSLAVVFWPLVLLTNVTEAYFFILGPLWFATLLVTLANPSSLLRSRPALFVSAARPVDAQARPRRRWKAGSRSSTAPTGSTVSS